MRDSTMSRLWRVPRRPASTSRGTAFAMGPTRFKSRIPATAPPAANSSGRVTVAWHDFRQNNYDIYLRQRSPRGGWDGERRLTRAESIDRHAVLVPHKDDLWLVYENARTEAYSTGRTNERRVMLARIMPRGLESPSSTDVARRPRRHSIPWAASG